jgi:hypothetical protein
MYKWERKKEKQFALFAYLSPLSFQRRIGELEIRGVQGKLPLLTSNIFNILATEIYYLLNFLIKSH